MALHWGNRQLRPIRGHWKQCLQGITGTTAYSNNTSSKIMKRETDSFFKKLFKLSPTGVFFPTFLPSFPQWYICAPLANLTGVTETASSSQWQNDRKLPTVRPVLILGSQSDSLHYCPLSKSLVNTAYTVSGQKLSDRKQTTPVTFS